MAYSSIIEELQDMHFALGNLSTLDIKTIYKPQKVEWTGLIGVAQDFLVIVKKLLGTISALPEQSSNHYISL